MEDDKSREATEKKESRRRRKSTVIDVAWFLTMFGTVATSGVTFVLFSIYGKAIFGPNFFGTPSILAILGPIFGTLGCILPLARAENRLLSFLRRKAVSGITSVAASMVHSRVKSFAYGVIPIVVILVASIANSLFFPTFSISSPILDSVLAAYVILCVADLWLMIYRIERGVFCDNEGEARELLSFINANRDKFDSGDGPARIFDPLQRTSADSTLAGGLTEGAGHV